MKSKMGVSLHPAAMMSTGSIDHRQKRHTRKQRPTINSLPLLKTGDHLNKWRRLFMPSLVKWAGSIEDPFSANRKMDETVINLWNSIYDDIPLNDENTVKVVINVVRLPWRLWTCDC